MAAMSRSGWGRLRPEDAGARACHRAKFEHRETQPSPALSHFCLGWMAPVCRSEVVNHGDNCTNRSLQTMILPAWPLLMNVCVREWNISAGYYHSFNDDWICLPGNCWPMSLVSSGTSSNGWRIQCFVSCVNIFYVNNNPPPPLLKTKQESKI